MNWLFLRGLVREQGHWNGFPQAMVAKLGGTALCIDLPGMGTERGKAIPANVPGFVDDMRPRFLAAKGIDTAPWGVFAVSLGGMVALDWLERFPNDFSRAVIVNTSAGDLSSPFERFNPRNLPKVFSAAITNDVLKRESTILSFVSNSSDEKKKPLAEAWAKISTERPTGVSVLLKQIWAGTKSKAPTRITVPTLLLASEADRLVSVDCSKRLAKRLSLPLELHDSAGHDLPFDAPDWVTSQISKWMAA